MCYLYLWIHSNNDCRRGISHHALWCPVCPAWVTLIMTHRMKQNESLSLSLSQCLSCFYHKLFFNKSNIPLCLSYLTLFLLVWVWHECQVEIMTAGTICFVQSWRQLHFLFLCFSAFRGWLFSTGEGRESPPCVCFYPQSVILILGSVHWTGGEKVTAAHSSAAEWQKAAGPK